MGRWRGRRTSALLPRVRGVRSGVLGAGWSMFWRLVDGKLLATRGRGWVQCVAFVRMALGEPTHWSSLPINVRTHAC